MNRQLGLYILLLNFFMLLIGGLWLYSLRFGESYFSFPVLLETGIKFLCPVFSTVFVLGTLKSVPSAVQEEESRMIDDLPPAEHFLFHPIAAGLKLMGVLASLLSVYIFADFCYSIYLFSKQVLSATDYNPVRRLSIVFVVFLFNAICQPWYVLRTFRNVKR